MATLRLRQVPQNPMLGELTPGARVELYVELTTGAKGVITVILKRVVPSLDDDSVRQIGGTCIAVQADADGNDDSDLVNQSFTGQLVIENRVYSGTLDF